MAWIANIHCEHESSPDKCRGNWTYSENSEWQEDQHLSVKCLGKLPNNMAVWPLFFRLMLFLQPFTFYLSTF